MIFSPKKQLSSTQLLSQVQIVHDYILNLSQNISKIQEAQSYFEDVELDSKQISNNLLNHANLVQNIASQLRGNPQINLKSVDQLLSYLIKWFQSYHQSQHTLCAKQKVIKVLQLQGKLSCLQQFMAPALIYKDDIAAFPFGSHPRYLNVYKIITIIQSDSPKETIQQYESFRRLITVTNAAVLTQLRQGNCFLSVMSFGLSYPRFLIDHKQAQLRNFAFLRKPQLASLLSIWNLPQNGAISKLKYVQFPCINTNKLVYIPLDHELDENLDIFTPSQGAVAVRILSNRPVVFWQQQKKCCSMSSQAIPSFDRVVIHAHGGGFIALSSSTMQNYTRLWSKQLDVPVLSIDYKKPPGYRFPAPVYDVFAVYKFVCTQLYKHCNIQPRTIIMAGDSAGSNLVLSATALVRRAGLPPPAGIFMAYPASDLRSIYSPSRIHSFSDSILHPSLLLLCLREYLGEGQKQVESDPLASPLLLSQAFFTGNSADGRWPVGWPRTRIIVGENDPLLDDSVRLCVRMVEGGVDVRCTIFRGLGHGFLSVEKVIKQGERGIEASIGMIREMLGDKRFQ